MIKRPVWVELHMAEGNNMTVGEVYICYSRWDEGSGIRNVV